MSLLEDLYWAAAQAARPVQALEHGEVVYQRAEALPVPDWPRPPCSRTVSGTSIHVRPSCRCPRGTVTP